MELDPDCTYTVHWTHPDGYSQGRQCLSAAEAAELLVPTDERRDPHIVLVMTRADADAIRANFRRHTEGFNWSRYGHKDRWFGGGPDDGLRYGDR